MNKNQKWDKIKKKRKYFIRVSLISLESTQQMKNILFIYLPIMQMCRNWISTSHEINDWLFIANTWLVAELKGGQRRWRPSKINFTSIFWKSTKNQ